MAEACPSRTSPSSESGAVQDNFWASTGAACDLIDIAGFSVTPEKAGLAGQDPIEAPLGPAGPQRRGPLPGRRIPSWLGEGPDPAARERAGVVYGDLDTLIFRKRAKPLDKRSNRPASRFVHESLLQPPRRVQLGPLRHGPGRGPESSSCTIVGEGADFALLTAGHGTRSAIDPS